MEYHQGTAVRTHYGSFRDKRERKRRSIIKEKTAENFPMDKETNKAQMTPNRINPKQITLRLIIIKLSKSRRKRILKVAIEKILAIYKRTPIILSANFSAKSHSPGGSVWYIQSNERKKNQPRIIYSETVIFSKRDNVFPRQIKIEGIHHH